jgi:hypothetical protein
MIKVGDIHLRMHIVVSREDGKDLMEEEAMAAAKQRYGIQSRELVDWQRLNYNMIRVIIEPGRKEQGE